MGKKGKSKSIPGNATSRKQEKAVRFQSQAQTVENRPSWRFSTVDRAGPFAWPKGSEEEAVIVDKLHSFDSMRWEDIQGKQHHYLAPSSLSKEAKNRLEEIQLDDEVENLFSFHLQGQPRIVCIKHNSLAKLLWYDPLHQVAPSKKKHT